MKDMWINLSMEEWGVVLDAVIAERRKSADPERDLQCTNVLDTIGSGILAAQAKETPHANV